MIIPEAVTLRGRAAAEALMVDVVRVVRRDGKPVTDPVTGVVTYPESLVYEGKGRVQNRNITASDHETVGAAVTVTSFQVQLPHHIDVDTGDRIHVLESAIATKSVGRVFGVEFVSDKTHQTKTTAYVKELS